MSNWVVTSFQRLLGATPELRSEERRLQPRYRMQFAVSVDAQGTQFAARSCDLSQTGIAIYCSGKFEIGATVMLTYALGDGSPAQKVAAIVRNNTGNRYGLEFLR